jgi:hypothetical protein
MFDMLFDSGENAAVAWHTYNLRPLKINYKGGFSRLPDGYAAGPGGLLAHCPVRGSDGKGGRSRQSTFHPFRIAQSAQKTSKREMNGSAGRCFAKFSAAMRRAPRPRHLLVFRLHFSRLGRH